METIEDKIARLAPEITEPRLAAREAEWLAEFAAQPRARSVGGMITTSSGAIAMALVIGVLGADPRWGADHTGSTDEVSVLSPFSAEAPLAPSTLLRD